LHVFKTIVGNEKEAIEGIINIASGTSPAWGGLIPMGGERRW
jgi:hypothetical protein